MSGEHDHLEFDVLAAVDKALAARLTDAEARLTKLEAAPTPTPAPLPPTAPGPSGPVTRLGAGTYANRVFATPGETVVLDPKAVLTAPVIAAPDVTIGGGRMEGMVRLRKAVAHRATLKEAFVRGGLYGILNEQCDGMSLIDLDIDDPVESAIAVFGRNDDGVTGRGVSGGLVERVRASIATGVTGKSVILLRGSEKAPFTLQVRAYVFRDIVLDQGTRAEGHFGLEAARASGGRVERGTFMGGDVLISLPDSDGWVIDGATFDLTTAWAAVEIANADDVVVENSIAVGNGAANSKLIYSNSTPQRFVGRRNRVTNVGALASTDGRAAPYGPGSGHRLTDNCLTNVPKIVDGPSGSAVFAELARNGACV